MGSLDPESDRGQRHGRHSHAALTDPEDVGMLAGMHEHPAIAHELGTELDRSSTTTHTADVTAAVNIPCHANHLSTALVCPAGAGAASVPCP